MLMGSARITPTALSTAAAAAPIPAAQPVREVRTTATGDFGLHHPAGVTYVPATNELLVAEAGDGVTSVLRLDMHEGSAGTFELPAPAMASTLAYDATSDEVTTVAAGDVVAAPGAELRTDRATVRRGAVQQLALRDPRGATFDAASGTWYVLDAGNRGVVVLPKGSAAQDAARIPLGHLGAGRLSGLAFNAEDDLLYVGAPDARLVHGLDENGTVHKTYSLASLPLRDPVAMTFAPSADPTDAEETRHLFVADAGDDQTSGGVTEITLAPAPALAVATETATLVRRIDTSQFNPASPDPSGVTYIPARDRLMVVDSEVDETTGAGYHGVNLWQLTRTGTVTDTGTTFPAYSREPTGLAFDPATNTLFISDDSARGVHAVKPGADGRYGTPDDTRTFVDAAAYGSDDTEDPAFDTVSRHLYFSDAIGAEIFRIDPVNGVFGDGNDVMTHFDVGQFGVNDAEGLAYDPARNTLLVGDRPSRRIYEVTKAGALVRIIDASGTAGLSLLSGLGVAPASNNTGQLNYWIVDRAVDNGANPNENDGKLFEVTLGTATPPTIIPGAATVVEGNSGTKTVNVPVTLTHPSSTTVTVGYQTLNHTATAPGDFTAASGTVSFAPGQTARTIPIVVRGDVVHEPNEIALVSLRNPVGATIGGFFGLAFVTITNDDPLPVVRPGAATAVEGNSGTKTVNLAVTLSHPSASTVTVAYGTLDNSATAPSDYVAKIGLVTFAPGQTAATAPLTIRGDLVVEPDELFLVSFLQPQGARIGGFYGLGFVFIDNDD
jgi:hypothetical protein